jgi:alpha-tubulin suppressor-like RCC1 family protein
MKTQLNLIQICLLATMLLPAVSSAAQPAVTKVATGENDTLFLKSDGSLWGMGYNDEGQLGDGTKRNAISPVEILPGGVMAIAAGADFSIDLKSDGTLRGMGDTAGWGVNNINSVASHQGIEIG